MPTKKKAPAAEPAQNDSKPAPQKEAAKASKPAEKAAVPKAKAPAAVKAAPAPKPPVTPKASPAMGSEPASVKAEKPVAAAPAAKPASKATAATGAKPTASATAASAAKSDDVKAQSPAKPSSDAAKKTASPAPAKPAPAPAKTPGKPSSDAAKRPASKTPAKPAPAPVKPPVERPEQEPLIAMTAPESKQAAIQSHALKQAELRKAAKAQQEGVKTQKAVPLPKITTTSSRKYEPEFTRSILDQRSYEPIGPSMRYSDAELQEFRELINRKLETARKEIAYLHGMITRKDSMSGEGDNRYMTMEDGSLSMEREQLSQMASRQHDFIDKLENAMVRIENKTYGVCRVSGKLIDKARLRAVPHATLTMEAKLGLARNPNIQ